MKNIELRKMMIKENVNKLIGEYILLEDDIYLGATHKHNWRCKCGNIIKDRKWNNIRQSSKYECKKCSNLNNSNRYKYEVEKDGEYEYIRSYLKGDTLPNGEIVKNSTIMQIRHIYCGRIYEVSASLFINKKIRCSKCCGEYENSFAHCVEVELGLKLEDIWDYNKNTFYPNYISKYKKSKVWIKCPDCLTPYKISYYNILDIIKNKKTLKCPYCIGNKSRPKEKFAQYHIDNTDKDFLNKYWDYEKNTADPYHISTHSKEKVWIKCQEKYYHGSYEISCTNFAKGRRCGYCSSKKVNTYDSFGYHNLDKTQSWHEDNDISPFRVALNSNKKYKFICEECETVFEKSLANITQKDQWCPECGMSTGEKEIRRVLRLNNIDYEYEKEFDGLVGLKYGNLSYDFYLPKYNKLIEYQGSQHKEFVPGWHINQEGFEKQLEHDRLKREYAINNGYGEVIEIWEDEFDNIELMLSLKVN